MIYGTPGVGLAHGTFGTEQNRRAGYIGERLTAVILNGFTDRAAIFHDIDVPHPRLTLNIDHAVVAGNRVLLIDSKLWGAGRYWSIGPHYFRGLQHAKPPSQAVAIAHEVMSEHLFPCKLPTPLVALWSGSQSKWHYAIGPDGRPTGIPVYPDRAARPFLHYNYPGARTITANDLHKHVDRFTRRARHPPNTAAVRYLTRLLNR